MLGKLPSAYWFGIIKLISLTKGDNTASRPVSRQSTDEINPHNVRAITVATAARITGMPIQYFIGVLPTLKSFDFDDIYHLTHNCLVTKQAFKQQLILIEEWYNPEIARLHFTRLNIDSSIIDKMIAEIDELHEIIKALLDISSSKPDTSMILPQTEYWNLVSHRTIMLQCLKRK